jgi:hypothetical protein
MLLHKSLFRVTLAAGLIFSAAPASAGWYAKQSTSNGKTSQDSEMYFQDHKLRVDNTDGTSVIIELPTGGFSFIDHNKKVVATATIDELVKMKDDMKAQMRAQLAKAPPEVRAKIEKQMDEQEAAMKADLKLVKTKKTEKVAGASCEVVTWTAPDGDGEACLAAKPGADIAEFKKDSIALGKKLSEKGAGKGATSMPLLQLAEAGFPMRTKRTLSMGPQKIDTITEIKEIKDQKVDPAKFTPPADYTKKTFQELMQMAMQPSGPPPGHP